MMISALAVVLASVAGTAVAQGASTACDGPPADTYKKCIGRDVNSLKACKDPDDQCVKFSKYYGQCRPKDNDRFDDDWLGIALDCTDCGPDSRQVGELNFASSMYCSIEFLGGSLTLSECQDACSNNNFVACDRPVSDPDTANSCYGYLELFEGGCFMRNEDDTFWESWLLCQEDRTAAPSPPSAPGAPGEPAVQDFGTDTGPATDDAESLAADIEADEEASDGGTMAQRARDQAGSRK